MNENKKSDFSSTLVKCVAAILCVAFLLISVSTAFAKLTDSNLALEKLYGEKIQPSSDADYSYTDSEASVTTDYAQSGESSTVGNIPATQTDTLSDSPESDEPQKGALTEVSDIVAYFNTSVNKIKPTAKKVVKNYEKRFFHEDKTQIPKAIDGMAKSLMSTMMGDDTEPIEYATKEEIRTNFIVPEQDYSSKLEASWVKSATCKDNGKEYAIHITLKDHENPTAGVGVGAVCDVIETHEVAKKVSFVESFTTTYYNCEITATVDKASGNVTHIIYSTPLLLNMKVNLLGSHSGVIAFTFVKDYSVYY